MRKTCGGCAYSRAIDGQMLAIYCAKQMITCGVHDKACEQYKLWLTEDIERENGTHPCKGCEDYIEPNGCKSNGGCAEPPLEKSKNVHNVHIKNEPMEEDTE